MSDAGLCVADIFNINDHSFETISAGCPGKASNELKKRLRHLMAVPGE
jgi:hypothetical protein